MKDSRIYLDHNATTPLIPEVKEAIAPFLDEMFGNPSSIHSFGREVRAAMDNARAQVAQLLGAKDPSTMIFTGGGTESVNMAIKGVVHALKAKGNHIITSKVEHPAVMEPLKFLEKEGCKVSYIPVDQYGVVDLDALKREITDKTILITVMFANNEIGTIEPIEEIAKIAKEKGVLFHTDAIQAVGKLPINVEALGIDLLSFSGHKIYAPKGTGVLYIKKGVKVTPLIHGGHHERRLRAGTENVPGVIGLGKACEVAKNTIPNEITYLTELRDRLYSKIEKNIEFVRMNGHPTKRLCNTLNVGFEFLEGESIILNLDMEGIAVSTGSACTSGTLEPSHVLLAIGLKHEITQGSLRFSLGRGNTKEDIDRVAEVLPPIIKRLRSMSPLYLDKIKGAKK